MNVINRRILAGVVSVALATSALTAAPASALGSSSLSSKDAAATTTTTAAPSEDKKSEGSADRVSDFLGSSFLDEKDKKLVSMIITLVVSIFKIQNLMKPE